MVGGPFGGFGMGQRMVERVDVAIVGGGAMGSAAAWQLAGRADTLLLERFEPGHLNGASHGASRNFNVSYADPVHVGMLVEAERLWRLLEAQTGTELLTQHGIVNHGPNPGHEAAHAALAAAGIPSVFVDEGEASERWPGIRFEGRVLFTPTAGRLHADRAVAALQRAAQQKGARVQHGARVTGIRPVGDEAVLTIETPEGVRDLRARRVVVTVGAWTSTLLTGHVPLPRLVVTQEQPAHFAPRIPGEWPGFNHFLADSGPDRRWPSNVYGMHTPGQGIKAGWHGVGPVIDPDRRSFVPDPALSALIRDYAREWLPGVDADDVTEITCTYTTTPDGVFVIDRRGPVVLGAGFSGHGFKFTPSVGRLLADLALDRAPAPAIFALDRF
ncbi:FAD-dependent oxidoreductase [Microbacterium sp. 22303]|uniref:FAD-dependent oxidoreductase n=1 Tax=Microbacterium sp. 22303 TaxID=3453905 RepID=UPI003F840784